MSYLIKFIQLPWKEKKLFAEALFFLYSAWLMNLILPFKSCLKMVKRSNLKDVEADPKLLKQIAIALHRANYLQIWKNTCLISSFAGRWMLNRRNINSELFFGGMKYDEDFKAHAWLTSCGKEIVRKENEYVILYKN